MSIQAIRALKAQIEILEKELRNTEAKLDLANRDLEKAEKELYKAIGNVRVKAGYDQWYQENVDRNGTLVDVDGWSTHNFEIKENGNGMLLLFKGIVAHVPFEFIDAEHPDALERIKKDVLNQEAE